MENERFRELCAAYFLEDLDESELNEFKKALDSGDKEFEKIFVEFQKLYFKIPLSVKPAEPPKRLKRNIFNTIRNNQGSKVGLAEYIIGILKLKNPRVALSLLALLIVSLIGLGYFSYMQKETIFEQNSRIVELTNKVEQNDAILKVISAKQFEVTILNGLQVNPGGYGKILWDAANKKAVLQISNLPPTNPDKDYQLWVIKNNKPVSNGIFSIKHEGEGFFEVTNLVETDRTLINAFAVTLEPKGGVPQPTGKMFLLGSPAPNI